MVSTFIPRCIKRAHGIICVTRITRIMCSNQPWWCSTQRQPFRNPFVAGITGRFKGPQGLRQACGIRSGSGSKRRGQQLRTGCTAHAESPSRGCRGEAPSLDDAPGWSLHEGKPRMHPSAQCFCLQPLCTVIPWSCTCSYTALWIIPPAFRSPHRRPDVQFLLRYKQQRSQHSQLQLLSAAL